MIGFEHELEHKYSSVATTCCAKALLRESCMNLKNIDVPIQLTRLRGAPPPPPHAE